MVNQVVFAQLLQWLTFKKIYPEAQKMGADDTARTTRALVGIIGKRLTYKLAR